MKVDLSLILPVYNQEDIIAPVIKDIIEKIKRLKINFEIILVENGSKDNSLKMIEQLENKYTFIKALSSEKGYGRAIRKGIQASVGRYISYMPSDGQVDMRVFQILWKEINKNEFEIIKVKRLRRENRSRLYISRFYSVLLKIIFNTQYLTDVNGNPRIMERKKINMLKIKSNDSFIDAEITIKARTRKWKIKEIPMRHLERIGGKSSRSMDTYLEFVKNILRYKLKPY